MTTSFLREATKSAAMKSIMQSKKFCANDTENAQVQTCILTSHFFKKKLWNEWMQKEELTGFTASNGWLEKRKQIYLVREKRSWGETDEFFTPTVQVLTGRLLELCQNYKRLNISNLDELGFFLKA